MKSTNRRAKVPEFVIDNRKAIVNVVEAFCETSIYLDTAVLGTPGLVHVDVLFLLLEQFQHILTNFFVIFCQNSDIAGNEL
ncbi:hypothetical protein WL56_05340 [Burkholderia cepacia]|nr:hypothetical protein WL56_05340 [Burkholderia cepacia]